MKEYEQFLKSQKELLIEFNGEENIFVCDYNNKIIKLNKAESICFFIVVEVDDVEQRFYSYTLFNYCPSDLTLEFIEEELEKILFDN